MLTLETEYEEYTFGDVLIVAGVAINNEPINITVNNSNNKLCAVTQAITFIEGTREGYYKTEVLTFPLTSTNLFRFGTYTIKAYQAGSTVEKTITLVPTKQITLPRVRKISPRVGLTEFLYLYPDTDWDSELERRVKKILGESTITDLDLADPVMMTITKMVEERLRSCLRKRGVPEEDLSQPGIALLSIACEIGFIEKVRGKEPDPIYYLLRWYFQALRRESHHEFKDYELNELISALSFTNYILLRLKRMDESC